MNVKALQEIQSAERNIEARMEYILRYRTIAWSAGYQQFKSTCDVLIR